VEIRAKQKHQKQQQAQDLLSVENSTNTEANSTYSHPVTIQCNTLLYTTLHNWVKAMHAANNFTYTSVTDGIRAAIAAYKDGMELTELEQKGKKKQTSIRLDDSLYDFYKGLPDQLRTKILERAIRTFLKNQL
jgi:hypothetical protein